MPDDWCLSTDWSWCNGSSQNVCAVLVDRPSEGAYVCWICGETRTDRRVVRALDFVHGHFNNHPYRCSETHLDPRTNSFATLSVHSLSKFSASLLFTEPHLKLDVFLWSIARCAEALKDPQTKMKNKRRTCNTWYVLLRYYINNCLHL